MQFKLEKKTLSDGCIQPYVEPVIRYAVKKAKERQRDRAGFPRFTVKVDGEHHPFAQERKLRQFLLSINIGADCEVFRNGGYGATINFDI